MPPTSNSSASSHTAITTLSQNFRYCHLSIRRCGERLHYEPEIFPPLDDESARKAPPTLRPKLLELPAELRTMIWEYVLHGDSVLQVGDCYHSSSLIPPKINGTTGAKKATQPAITSVSRQIRSESLPLFYHLNSFVLAIHCRRAKNESKRWLSSATANPAICANLNKVTIIHRFGMLHYEGIVEFDLKHSRISFCSTPPFLETEVKEILKRASAATTPDDYTIVTIVSGLVELLGA